MSSGTDREGLELSAAVDEAQARLDSLRAIVGAGPVLILTHDNPDPDALASGSALAALLEQKWGVIGHPVFSGLVTRAENQAVLNLLTPEWRSVAAFDDLELDEYSAIALVDTQPNSGNHILPAGVIPDVVIDHHATTTDALAQVRWADVRPDIGATASLVYLLVEAAGIEPDERLATAIFYAIQTDTRSLTRSSSPIDYKIYFKMLARIDREAILKVEQARLPREYFKAFVRGLQAARVIGRAVVSYMGPMHRPDFVAELADVLIRFEGATAVLCLGHHAETMYLSLRVSGAGLDAGRLIQKIIVAGGHAGGHGMIAGGRVALGDSAPNPLAEAIERRFLEEIEATGASAESLLS